MSLRWRLALLIVLLSAVPAVCAGLLSRQLIDRTFNLGFSESIDEALDAGLRRSRQELRAARTGLARDADAAAAQWPDLPAELGRDGDGIVLEHASQSTRVLRDGAVRHQGEGAPTAIEHRVELADGWSLVWVRPTDPQWRDDAAEIAETLQMVRGLRAARDEWERRFWLPFLLVYAITLFVGIAVALRISRTITTPVDRLVHGADAVASGDWNVQLVGEGRDELGVLTGNFNAMVRTLDAQSRRLIDLETMAGWREMARALAHEVKNPLTPIQLTVEEMRERYRGDDPEYAKLLDECSRIVVEEVDSLRSVVTRFREFSRPVELKPQPTDLGRLVADVAALQRDFRVEVEVPADLGSVDLDEDRFRQVLMNLCENSRQALRGQESPRLALVATDTGATVKLQIEDNGPGIPEDQREKVFEPYKSQSAGGLGLGLALVKGIVLAHGGSIRVDRSRWDGCMMVIELPRELAAQQETT